MLLGELGDLRLPLGLQLFVRGLDAVHLWEDAVVLDHGHVVDALILPDVFQTTSHRVLRLLVVRLQFLNPRQVVARQLVLLEVRVERLDGLARRQRRLGAAQRSAEAAMGINAMMRRRGMMDALICVAPLVDLSRQSAVLAGRLRGLSEAKSMALLRQRLDNSDA